MKNGNEEISYNGISYATRARGFLSFKKDRGIGESAERGDGLDIKKVLEAIPIDLAMQDEKFITAWIDWIGYRLDCQRIHRWKASIHCFERMMRLCERLGPQKATEAIDRSIMLGYRGLFEDSYQENKSRQKTAEERKRAKWGCL
jgi:hypothetical protein